MTAYVGLAMEPERVPLREPLSQMPNQIGDWSGREAPELSANVLEVLGVDDHLNRYYVAPAGLVGLYIGYYESQRQGDTIHSPMNCLPGAGWQPVDVTRVLISVEGQPDPIVVNQVLIAKGLDRQVVLYWYQSHGRVVASEYWSKIFMVTDAIRLHRSDAALVRVVSPLKPGETDISHASSVARAFVQTVFPYLDRYLPS
jgi:EpsI family protein